VPSSGGTPIIGTPPLPTISLERRGMKISSPTSIRLPTKAIPAGLVAAAIASCGSAMPTPAIPLALIP